jgi:hypothetical protein
MSYEFLMGAGLGILTFMAGFAIGWLLQDERK